jgi:hypothetical protein
MVLSFIIASGPRQLSHSQVWVPRNSWPHFTFSDSRLHQPGGPGSRINISQEQGCTGFPFRRLLRLAGLRWRYSTPPAHGFLHLSCLRSSLFSLGAVFTENSFSKNTLLLRVYRFLLTDGFFYCCAFASAGICLPSRCLVMNYFGFQVSCRNILKDTKNVPYVTKYLFI